MILEPRWQKSPARRNSYREGPSQFWGTILLGTVSRCSYVPRAHVF